MYSTQKEEKTKVGIRISDFMSHLHLYPDRDPYIRLYRRPGSGSGSDRIQDPDRTGSATQDRRKPTKKNTPSPPPIEL